MKTAVWSVNVLYNIGSTKLVTRKKNIFEGLFSFRNSKNWIKSLLKWRRHKNIELPGCKYLLYLLYVSLSFLNSDWGRAECTSRQVSGTWINNKPPVSHYQPRSANNLPTACHFNSKCYKPFLEPVLFKAQRLLYLCCQLGTLYV